TAYTGTLYLDQVFLRGITSQQKDALAAHNVAAQYTYAPTLTQTLVKQPDQDGTLRSRAVSYGRTMRRPPRWPTWMLGWAATLPCGRGCATPRPPPRRRPSA